MYWCDDGCGRWHLTSQPLPSAVAADAAPSAELIDELKIYESPDVARAAVLVATVVPDVGGSAHIDDLAERWRRRYPRHVAAHKPIIGRLKRGLRALAAVGIVALTDDVRQVAVVDIDALQMVAQNLDVLEDSVGWSRRPSKWRRLPEVPAHLRAVQNWRTAKGHVGWDRIGHGVGGAQPASPARQGPWFAVRALLRRLLPQRRRMSSRSVTGDQSSMPLPR